MDYGFVITCQDSDGDLFTISESGFESYDEVRAAVDDRWSEIEDDGDGCKPINFEIFEN